MNNLAPNAEENVDTGISNTTIGKLTLTKIFRGMIKRIDTIISVNMCFLANIFPSSFSIILEFSKAIKAYNENPKRFSFG